MVRIPLITGDDLTSEQQRVYDAIVSGPRGVLRGPLMAALHRPELAQKWQEFGELLRYRTSIPARLSEFAILVTARQMHCQLEWLIHEEMALNAGLERDIIEALREGRRPEAEPIALSVHDFAIELQNLKSVTTTTYNAVLDAFGVVGVVELTALVGYYTMVAMTLNAHEFPLPEGAEQPLRHRSMEMAR